MGRTVTMWYRGQCRTFALDDDNEPIIPGVVRETKGDCQLCRWPHWGKLCPWPAIEERGRTLDAIADVADACGVSMEERLALLKELQSDTHP